MIDLALHIQHRHAAGLGDGLDIGVADAPVALADGDAISITTDDFADFLGGIAMADCVVVLSMNWAWPPSCAMPASKLMRVRVLVKKNSSASTLSRSKACGLAQGALSLQIPSHIQQRSISSFDQSCVLMRSRPLKSFCIARS